MASKNRPYEQFGDYILLKRLELDGLGDLFRAVRVDGGTTGPVVAIRRLSGGNREALAAAAEEAGTLVPSLTGSTFAKDQRIGVIAGVPFVAHDYASGRSLRYIVDRARGNGGTAAPNPIPLDQAIVIAERVALSLATTGDLRHRGERLVHAGLIPQFIWITEDGEIRVAGQCLGAGLTASLRDEKVANDIGRYFSPETQHSAKASKSAEVYSLGAILFLLVTGQEPPDATRTSAFAHAIRAGKTFAGEPIPEDIRAIIEKSLNIDPAARFATPSDMRNALSALASGGKYAATSFNLAFYLSNLLKKEMEAEALERQRESALNIAPYLNAETHSIEAPAPLSFGSAEPAPDKKSRVPAAIAAAVVLAAAGAGAWFFLGTKQQAGASPAVVTASAIATAPPTRPQVEAPEPIVATLQATEDTDTASPAEGAATATQTPEEIRKKLFEDAVKKRLQQEMLKLQAEYTRELQQQQSRNAPVLSPSATSVQATRPQEDRLSAAELDQERREASRAEDLRTTAQESVVATTATQAPVVPSPAVTNTIAPPPPQAAPAIREGDVVAMDSLDRAPELVREPRPVYPPIAARQKIEATVMASVLVSESGEVLDVKVLRGEPRFGFNDAAIRAFRAARYSPAMKDGKRVRTWVPQMIHFRP